MNALFNLAIIMACCNLSIINTYAQKMVSSGINYNQFLAFQYPGNVMFHTSSNIPIVKLTMDETINISLDNKNVKQSFKTAKLNFSSQSLMSSKIIAAPIDPSSPLLHDDNHVLALSIHSRISFPLLIKFALYF